MTTQAQINLINNLPVSTTTAVSLAEERRIALQADINTFLLKGGKINVIEKPLIKQKDIKELLTFNGKSKENQQWLNRLKYVQIIKEHGLKTHVIATKAGLSTQMLGRYLNGTTKPLIETRKKLEATIDTLSEV